MIIDEVSHSTLLQYDTICSLLCATPAYQRSRWKLIMSSSDEHHPPVVPFLRFWQQGRIYSKQGPVRKNVGPLIWGGRHYFSWKKNWRPFLVITVAFIHFTRSLGCRPLFPSCQKFADPLVGPLFVVAPVRPNMLNTPKSAAVWQCLQMSWLT